MKPLRRPLLSSAGSPAIRLVLAAVLLELGIAQGFGQKFLSAADQAFVQLKSVAIPIEPAVLPAGGRKTKEQVDSDRKLQSAGFLAAADKAREFYTTYPTHERRPRLKKS